MEELENLSYEEVLEVIKNFPLVPEGNRIVVTLNREVNEDELILDNNTLDEEQYVIAVGPMAERNLQPGDRIILDLEKMVERVPLAHDQTQMSSQIKIDPIEIDGKHFTFTSDRCYKAKYKPIV